MGITLKNITFYLKLMLAVLLLPIFWSISILQMIWPTAEKDVKGKVVLITGAANGLGKETALQFAQKGSIVVCVDMKKKDLEEAAKMIKSYSNGKAEVHCFTCDITDRQAVTKLSEGVLKKFGRVDILVNNAGALYGSTFSGGTDEDIIRVVDINILGQCWVTRAFLPSMQKRNEGHIVFISSSGAILNLSGMNIYCMTKAAVSGIVLSLKDEIENNPKWSNIKITGIHPSIISSGPFVQHAWRVNFPVMSCSYAASAVVSAIRRNRFEVCIPGNELALRALYLFRAMPWAFHKMAYSAADAEVGHPSDKSLYTRYFSSESIRDLNMANFTFTNSNCTNL